MRTASYHIVSHWRVSARLHEVVEIFRDSERLVDWWPAAFLEVRTLRKGDENELGKRVWLRTKGWLPYTLSLTFEITECSGADSFALVVDGDFEGGCRCRAEEAAGALSLEFDWQVEVRKPLVRYSSWLLRPLFTANHKWVMRMGEKSLRLELERQRGASDRSVSRAPGPTFPFDPVSSRIRSWLAPE